MPSTQRDPAVAPKIFPAGCPAALLVPSSVAGISCSSFLFLTHLLLITHTHTHSKQHRFPVKPLFPHHLCSPALAGVLVAVSGCILGRLDKDQRKQAMGLKRATREKASKERVLCLNLCTFPSFIPPSATSLLWSLLLHEPTHHYSCLHTITSNNNNS